MATWKHGDGGLDGWLLIDKGAHRQKGAMVFSFLLLLFNHRSVFILSEQECSRDRAPVSLTAVTLKRWMNGWSKESHLFPLTHSVKWIEAEPFDLAFTLPSPPRPKESTLLPQLLQTEKVMGLRFCPDKGVRTLSLLLTPLSHH